ncbi:MULTISPECIES: hypothetical protein [Halobacterium]|uniref:Small CPxCG-related zinc finger protein n=5 Tax=Halobacterium salinarum TaxID=2242 RepID=A0A510N6W5_HALSA|nr:MULTISPECIES: hypothetical protein [Halobacterium]MBB6088768.1 uncharacterized protein with PIN domain [Halobacterium salinarum]MCF2165277.1 hypothetical protein [Halobacterium salinarum]MCF2167914.1 hypothetical protein [Halobacterium salinarum]MCF2206332.1 hypothetical protein [Halobacterium salinarum]MCF2239446.1 hypothetical protein [Halobacterium salinarum]
MSEDADNSGEQAAEATDTQDHTETDAESEASEATERSEDVVVDLDSAAAYEQRVDELEAVVEEQREQIEELEDLMLDLSVRAADDKGMGVCPECHGPVEKIDPWFGATRIECRRCGEVYHEY